MTTKEIAQKLNLTLCAGKENDNTVEGCYIGDLLSLAMSKVKCGYIWITVQTNINTVAVATLADAALIILPDNLTPDENTVKRADMEEMPIYTSSKSAYELASEISELI